jgi:hypothetical protein
MNIKNHFLNYRANFVIITALNSYFRKKLNSLFLDFFKSFIVKSEPVSDSVALETQNTSVLMYGSMQCNREVRVFRTT